MSNFINQVATPTGLIGFGIFVILALAAMLLSTPGTSKRQKARIAAMKPQTAKEARKFDIFRFVQSTGLDALGEKLSTSNLIGATERAKIVTKLSNAGFKGRNFVAAYLVIKLFLMIGLPILASGIGAELGEFGNGLMMDLLIPFGGLVAGWYIPDLVMGQMAKTRRQRLSEGIADAIDLLVICVEAGLGLEQGLDRVARDIARANPVVASELAITCAEMRIMPQLHDALYNFAKRSNLDTIKSIVTTLIQALQYGTPLSNSLRVIAAEMRTHRMLQIEAKAARLPVLMTVPLILFILPCLFMVIMGPAMLRIMDTMSSN